MAAKILVKFLFIRLVYFGGQCDDAYEKVGVHLALSLSSLPQSVDDRL